MRASKHVYISVHVRLNYMSKSQWRRDRIMILILVSIFKVNVTVLNMFLLLQLPARGNTM